MLLFSEHGIHLCDLKIEKILFSLLYINTHNPMSSTSSNEESTPSWSILQEFKKKSDIPLCKKERLVKLVTQLGHCAEGMNKPELVSIVRDEYNASVQATGKKRLKPLPVKQATYYQSYYAKNREFIMERNLHRYYIRKEKLKEKEAQTDSQSSAPETLQDKTEVLESQLPPPLGDPVLAA